MQLGVGLGLPYNLGKPAAEFSPLDLSPVLWLDAADTSTITESGGAVSQWDDKSGNGNHVTQGTAAAQPTTGTQTINSLNVIDFDGSADRLVRASTNIFRNVSSGSIYAVVKGTYVGATGLVLGTFANDSTTSSRAALFKDSTRLGAGGRRLDADSGVVHYSATLTNDAAYIVGALFDWANADLTLRTNATETVLDPFQTSGLTSDTASRVVIGGNDSGSFFDGVIAEVIFVGSVLSAGEIAVTESYLADKWGITL